MRAEGGLTRRLPLVFLAKVFTLRPMLEPLTNSEIRKFKAAAQLMDATLKVGKAGLSDGFIRTVSDELNRHELVKIKFAEFKEEKKTLAPLLAEKTSSHLVMRVGNVMVLHRPKPAAESIITVSMEPMKAVEKRPALNGKK